MKDIWEIALLFCGTFAAFGIIVYAVTGSKRRPSAECWARENVVKVVTPSGVKGYVARSVSPEALEQMAQQLRAAIPGRSAD